MSDEQEQVPAEDEGEGLDEETLAALQAMAQQRMGMGMPRQQMFACASCLNGQKIAIIDLSKKLESLGFMQGTPEFGQAMQAAYAAGQALANGQALGMNGQKPDVIPAVRMADTMINGTYFCGPCFPAAKQTGLLTAGPGWAPGKLPGR